MTDNHEDINNGMGLQEAWLDRSVAILGAQAEAQQPVAGSVQKDWQDGGLHARSVGQIDVQ